MQPVARRRAPMGAAMHAGAPPPALTAEGPSRHEAVPRRTPSRSDPARRSRPRERMAARLGCAIDAMGETAGRASRRGAPLLGDDAVGGHASVDLAAATSGRSRASRRRTRRESFCGNRRDSEAAAWRRFGAARLALLEDPIAALRGERSRRLWARVAASARSRAWRAPVGRGRRRELRLASARRRRRRARAARRRAFDEIGGGRSATPVARPRTAGRRPAGAASHLRRRANGDGASAFRRCRSHPQQDRRTRGLSALKPMRPATAGGAWPAPRRARRRIPRTRRAARAREARAAYGVAGRRSSDGVVVVAIPWRAGGGERGGGMKGISRCASSSVGGAVDGAEKCRAARDGDAPRLGFSDRGFLPRERATPVTATTGHAGFCDARGQRGRRRCAAPPRPPPRSKSRCAADRNEGWSRLADLAPQARVQPSDGVRRRVETEKSRRVLNARRGRRARARPPRPAAFRRRARSATHRRGRGGLNARQSPRRSRTARGPRIWRALVSLNVGAVHAPIETRGTAGPACPERRMESELRRRLEGVPRVSEPHHADNAARSCTRRRRRRVAAASEACQRSRKAGARARRVGAHDDGGGSAAGQRGAAMMEARRARRGRQMPLVLLMRAIVWNAQRVPARRRRSSHEVFDGRRTLFGGAAADRCVIGGLAIVIRQPRFASSRSGENVFVV